MTGMVACCGAAVGLFAGYAVWENAFWLRLRRYSLSLPGLTGEPCRVLLLSDLHGRHFGRGYRQLIQTIREASPEVILIAGDLVSRDCRAFSDVGTLLTQMAAICPVYYGFGNHELDLPQDARHALLQTAAESGVMVLDNAVAALRPGLWVAGASLRHSLYRDENNGFRHLTPYRSEDLAEDLGQKPNGCTILLGHNPLCLSAYAAWGAELVLSGHVHGGAVRLPGIGILSPERRFFPRYAKGVYREGGTAMVVSGGLGKLRLFNPPEICLITLSGENAG